MALPHMVETWCITVAESMVENSEADFVMELKSQALLRQLAQAIGAIRRHWFTIGLRVACCVDRMRL